MQHNLRYLTGSEENEPERKWNKEMHVLLREMIHYKNGLGGKEAERKIVEEFEKRYDRILEKAGKEYEDEPPKSHQPEPPPFCSRPFCQYHSHSARRGSEPRLPSSICSGHTYAPSGYAPHP